MLAEICVFDHGFDFKADWMGKKSQHYIGSTGSFAWIVNELVPLNFCLDHFMYIGKLQVLINLVFLQITAYKYYLHLSQN